MTDAARSSGRRLVAISASLEIAAGIGFLLAPALVVPLLFRVEMSEGVTVLARCFGIAIAGIGVICLPGRGEPSAAWGAVHGLALYNALIAAFLLQAVVAHQLAGPLLWPIVAVHAAFAILLAMGRRGR
jgi:hypothetical protein